MPAGLGPEKNRQWETIPGHHPRPDLRDGRDRGPAFIIAHKPNMTTPSPGEDMGTDPPRVQDTDGKKGGHGPKVTPMASAPASQEAG